MTKFTPGPWKEQWRGSENVEVVKELRYEIALLNGYVGTEELKANARLITASPNMWVAIRNLVTALDDGRIKLSDNNRALVIETHLRAALELATGDSDERNDIT